MSCIQSLKLAAEVEVIPRLRSDLSKQVRGKTRSLLSAKESAPEMSYPAFWLHLQDDSDNLKFAVYIILPSSNGFATIDADLQNRARHTVTFFSHKHTFLLIHV